MNLDFLDLLGVDHLENSDSEETETNNVDVDNYRETVATLSSEDLKNCLDVMTNEETGHSVEVQHVTVDSVLPTNDDKFKCKGCNKSFSNKSNLQWHMKLHTGKMSSCLLCGKQFFSQWEMKRHRDSVHEYKTYKCDHESCSKTSMSSYGLKNHKRQHNGNFKLLCQHCGKGFNYKTDYENHVFQHENKKPFSCMKCKKTFRIKANMTRHAIYCGDKSRSFSCDTCGRKFKCERYVKEHLKGHDDPEKYQCCTCGNFYKYRASLYKHSKKTGHS